MAATRIEGGLEVNTYEERAAQAPELDPRCLDMPNKKLSNHFHAVQPIKLPFGWSLWGLLALAAVISALVVGAGIGGGLGAQLADCKKYV